MSSHAMLRLRQLEESEATEDYETEVPISLHIWDPNEGSDPSERYGLKLAGPLFASFILLGALLTFLIMRCSKREEEKGTNVGEGTSADTCSIDICSLQNLPTLS